MNLIKKKLMCYYLGEAQNMVVGGDVCYIGMATILAGCIMVGIAHPTDSFL
ncbi:MAG: hypothetical protein ACUZ8N_12915 [Candidatus Scalindua sp.]